MPSRLASDEVIPSSAGAGPRLCGGRGRLAGDAAAASGGAVRAFGGGVCAARTGWGGWLGGRKQSLMKLSMASICLRMSLFFPVGFLRNRELLELVFSFSRVLNQKGRWGWLVREAF